MTSSGGKFKNEYHSLIFRTNLGILNILEGPRTDSMIKASSNNIKKGHDFNIQL